MTGKKRGFKEETPNTPSISTALSVCAFQLFLFGKNRYAVDIFPDGNQRLSFIQRLVEIDKIQSLCR